MRSVQNPAATVAGTGGIIVTPEEIDSPPSRDLTVLSSIPSVPLAALLTTLAVTWLLMLLHEGGAADHVALAQLYAAGHPWLILAAKGLSSLGIPPVYYAVATAAAVVLAVRGRFVAAVLLMVMIVFGRMVEQFQKVYFALPRPPEHLHLAPTSSFAFPSGHAANATVAYLGAALVLAGCTRSWRWTVAAALVVTFLIGVSRVMLGVHWPTDVVGGWAFGGFWTIAWLRLAGRLSERKLQVGRQL